MPNLGKKAALWSGAAAAVGAATYYFLEGERGKQRRDAFLRKAERWTKNFAEGASKYTRNVRHRLKGIARQGWADNSQRPTDDRVLEERIRSRMGRIVTHPHRTHVASEGGVVTLWGVAKESEIRKLIYALHSMPGVAEVLNHLEPDTDRGTESISLKQAHQETLLAWSPTARLAAGAAGTAIAAYGWKRKDRLGVFLAFLGAGLAVASTMKRNLHSVLAFSEDSPGFELEETIRINAPISDLYDFWVNPENYPKVFSHIKGIDRLGENLYRWTVNGPAGVPIHWDGRITRAVPNTMVEWKSLPGSTVGNFGIARFDPHYDASTRLHVRMFYRPPAGILGRFLAELLGSDPKKVLQQDLKRLKLRFETEENLIRKLKEGNEATELLKTAGAKDET